MLRHQKTLGNSILTGCLIPSERISGFDSQGCVISTFEQHTMPSISDVKKRSNGSKLLSLGFFCIGFIISSLAPLSSLLQPTGMKGMVSSILWRSALPHASRNLGMLVPKPLAASHLRGWTIPLPGILPRLSNTWCCCPWASPGWYKSLCFGNWEWFVVLQGWNGWGSSV